MKTHSFTLKLILQIGAILFLCLPILCCQAQTQFRGTLKNKSGNPISATITVQDKKSPIISGYGRSNAKGEYTISYQGKADSVKLEVSGMLIGKHSKVVANKSQEVNFEISEKVVQLKEVMVRAEKIRQNKDTIDYLVSAFTDQNDRVIGDALKKMPGIEVAESGKLSFNGKEISKFYVENMDLLQGRYGIATNNIPVKAVSAVQVLENHQPIKALRQKLPTGEVAINLKLKDSAKGTLTVTGALGGGYQPLLWNAELNAMFFGKKTQNITDYKGNNSGEDVASVFRTHYDYERIYINPSSQLQIQMPQTPSVPAKRYIDNRSHAITTNHLIKRNQDTELTTNILYYDDKIEQKGYSLYEQFLPSSKNLIIEEQLASTSYIHNMQIASRINVNKEHYYLNNAFNIQANWNSDTGTGTTANSASKGTTQLFQHLNQPFFSIDNTINLIKTKDKNAYKLYFSIGYGQRHHDLTVSPVDYLGKEKLESMNQDLMARDLGSILRFSYGFKYKKIRMDYDLWGRADIRNLNTDLTGKPQELSDRLFGSTFQNNLWYNTYQSGIYQGYSYENDSFKATLNLPLIYYVLTDNNKVPNTHDTFHRLSLLPSLSLRYELRSFTFNASGDASRNFGDMNSSYTGFIMNGYRSLMRNTADKLLEMRSANAMLSASYKDIFTSFFVHLGVNYGYSWKNLLYGFNYENIMAVKTTIDSPTEVNNYGIKLIASKGMNFWSATLRFSGNYNTGNGQQLIQGDVLNSRFRNYGANIRLIASPFSFLGFNYSLSGGKSQSYLVGRSSDFPSIKQISHTVGINIFPTKTITVNMNIEHQYNNRAGQRYTTFADAGIKWKNRLVDIELVVNNLFNAKKYVSASYNDISSYYYSYNLRPLSALLKFRFKIK